MRGIGPSLPTGVGPAAERPARVVPEAPAENDGPGGAGTPQHADHLVLVTALPPPSVSTRRRLLVSWRLLWLRLVLRGRARPRAGLRHGGPGPAKDWGLCVSKEVLGREGRAQTREEASCLTQGSGLTRGLTKKSSCSASTSMLVMLTKSHVLHETLPCLAQWRSACSRAERLQGCMST